MSVLDCKQYKTHNRVFILLLIIQKVKKQRRSAGFIFALVMDSNKSTIFDKGGMTGKDVAVWEEG